MFGLTEYGVRVFFDSYYTVIRNSDVELRQIFYLRNSVVSIMKLLLRAVNLTEYCKVIILNFNG